MFPRLQYILGLVCDAIFAALWWSLALGFHHRTFLTALLALFLLTWLPYIGLRTQRGLGVADEPQGLGWERLTHDFARRLISAATFWGLAWNARALGLGSAGFWNQAFPLGVSGVLLVSAMIGQDNPRKATSRRLWVLLPLSLLGFFAVLLNPWALACDEVWRETRKFNRGVFLFSGLLLGLCSSSHDGLVLAVGLTAFALVLPPAYAFAAYRKLNRVRLAASSGIGG